MSWAEDDDVRAELEDDHELVAVEEPDELPIRPDDPEEADR